MDLTAATLIDSTNYRFFVCVCECVKCAYKLVIKHACIDTEYIRMRCKTSFRNQPMASQEALHAIEHRARIRASNRPKPCYLRQLHW